LNQAANNHHHHHHHHRYLCQKKKKKKGKKTPELNETKQSKEQRMGRTEQSELTTRDLLVWYSTRSMPD